MLHCWQQNWLSLRRHWQMYLAKLIEAGLLVQDKYGYRLEEKWTDYFWWE